MGTKWNFTIDDTSPLFTYWPYSDAFGNGLTSGWQTWYTGSGFIKKGGDASAGTSFHLTNLTNASVTLQFYGSGIYLYGKAGSPYGILLDSQQSQASAQDGDLLFTKTDLQADTHYITLQAQISDPSSQTLGFHRAVIESTLENHAAAPSQQVFDNQNTTFFQYSSGWSTATDPQIPTRSDPRPYHQTSQKDAAVSFSFTNTTTVAINGSINWGHGLYQVLLDGQGTTFNASSTWIVPDSLIFYRDNLDPGSNHTINVTNFSEEKMTLNYVTLYNTQGDVATPNANTDTPATRTHVNKGLIAACVVSALAVLALLTGLLIWLLQRRPRRVKRTSSVSGRDLFGGMGFPGSPNTAPQPYPARAVDGARGDVGPGRPASGKMRSAATNAATRSDAEHASSSAWPVVFAAPAQPAPPVDAPDVDRIVELLAQRIDRTHDDPAGPPPVYR